MRKLLFFLCALLGGISGAKAEETISLNESFNCHIRNAATSNGYVSSDYKCVSSKDEAATFTITAVTIDDKPYYTIYNTVIQQYVNFAGTTSGTENVLINSTDLADNSYWSLAWGISDHTNTGEYTDYGFYITPKGGENVSWNFFGGNTVGKSIGLWGSGQNGTWVFEVEDVEDVDWICTINSSSRGSWAVESKNATKLASTNPSDLNLAYDATDTKQQFALILFEGNYYIYILLSDKTF